jgi:two-component system response regulator WspF
MKIGIVNDTLMAAQVIAMVLEKSGKHDVLWTVANGAEAITRCVQQQPDLILMDLVMPGLNGAETTREILKRCSVAVLVVTASVGTNCSLAFQAMGAGALDVIATPTLNNQAGQEAFLRKIGQIQAIISTAQEPAPSPPVCRPDDLSCGGDGTAGRLVAIGCSAGGPTALSEILSSLPPLPDTAVVLVQHIDQRFVGELVEWLTSKSLCPVHLATEDALLRPETVYVSAAAGHLEVHACARLRYTDQPLGLACKPSVDVLFASIVRNWRGRAMGAVLTGMGRDGANGLLQMRARGFLTLAQDQATSAIFGMPKAAAVNGAAAEVLPLRAIAARIQRWSQTGE